MGLWWASSQNVKLVAFSAVTCWLGKRQRHLACTKMGVVVFGGDSLTGDVAPVVATTSIILSSSKINNGDILVPAYLDNWKMAVAIQRASVSLCPLAVPVFPCMFAVHPLLGHSLSQLLYFSPYHSLHSLHLATCFQLANMFFLHPFLSQYKAFLWISSHFLVQGGHTALKVLEKMFPFSRTWKVLENGIGPWKFWNLM